MKLVVSAQTPKVNSKKALGSPAALTTPVLELETS